MSDCFEVKADATASFSRGDRIHVCGVTACMDQPNGKVLFTPHCPDEQPYEVSIITALVGFDPCCGCYEAGIAIAVELKQKLEKWVRDTGYQPAVFPDAEVAARWRALFG